MLILFGKDHSTITQLKIGWSLVKHLEKLIYKLKILCRYLNITQVVLYSYRKRNFNLIPYKQYKELFNILNLEELKEICN